MTSAKRLLWPMIVVALIIGACSAADEEPEDEEVPEDIIVEGELVTPNSLATEDAPQEEDPGVLEIATLLPFESGRFEGDHWVKLKLDGPILVPLEFHTTFQVNFFSAQDDVFGVGWTYPVDGAPFASGFCLDDRPNCADGTVDVDVNVGSEGELIFRIPEGTFGEATNLEFDAFIQTFPSIDADPVTEFIGDGARIPLGTDERDPC